MALSTYADLRTAIAGWFEREDAEFIARVPDFITLAEQRFNYGGSNGSGLRTADMEAVASLTPDGSGVLTLPADYLELRSADPGVVGYGAPILAAPDRLTGMVPRGGVVSDYAIRGNKVTTYPASSRPVTLSYYAKVPALSDANPTNWLLTKAPGAYLYGALIEASTFELDDGRAGTWAKLYAEAIAGLKHSDVGARFANAAVRVRGPTP